MTSRIVWRKSSFSGSDANCVEVAWVPEGVLYRDSKDPDGPVLRVQRAAGDAEGDREDHQA